jgi:hypothetical protein
MYDTVKNVTITYHINKKRFYPAWVSLGNICLYVSHICE